MPKVEYKYIDQGINQTPTSSSSIPLLLNGISQGTDMDERVGRKYTLTTCQFKLRYVMNASATDTVIRTMIFWDKQANGATAAISGTLITPLSVTGLKQPNNASRFRILYDKPVSLSINGTRETYRQYYKRFKLNVQCNATNAGDITDINTGALYIYFISDEATNTPTVNGSIRIWFTDV